MFQGPKGYIAQICKVHLQSGNSTTKWPFFILFSSKYHSNIYSILFVYNLHTSLTSLIYKRFYLTFFIKKFIRFNPEFSVLIIYLKIFNFSFSMFLMNCKYPMYFMYSMYTIYLFMNTTSPLI